MSNFAKDDGRIDIDVNATDITPETFRKHIRSLGRYDFPDPTMVDPDGIGMARQLDARPQRRRLGLHGAGR